MEKHDRERARELIARQRDLLAAVAEGRRAPDEADAEYKRTHVELRALLARHTLPCFCPWGSVKPWAYGGYGDWPAEIERMATPLRDIIEPPERTVWRLVLYRRNGDPDDLPFDQEFEASLSQEKWAVLDASLREELAQHGTTLLTNQKKSHPMPCPGVHRPQPSVDMYKIREAASSGRVVLRVFFETAAEHTIVLLHGYDKGRADSETRQRAEAKVACQRRADLLSQLADTQLRTTALDTERT